MGLRQLAHNAEPAMMHQLLPQKYTVGRDEETIKKYIRSQSAHDAKIEQLKIQN